MNRLLAAGIAALLATTLAFPAVSSARKILNMHEPIAFSHARHGRLECTTCHAATPASTAPSSPVQLTLPFSCQNCHTITDEKPPAEGCVNCHNDVSLL